MSDFKFFFSLGLHFSPVAMSHLNGQKVFGKVMRVTLSKHQTVALPREGLDDQLLTKGKMILEGNKQYLSCCLLCIKGLTQPREATV